MSPMAFFRLCKTLEGKGLFTSTVHMSVREQVLMFLHLLGHKVRFRVIEGRFFCSTWIIHYYFHTILQAILKLYPEFISPPSSSTPLKILNSSRFYPCFEDYIRALDDTYVHASIPLGDQDRYRNRKGGLSQNVLAAVSFDDLKFTYVLARWEVLAHDSRVLNDAITRGLRAPEDYEGSR
uniref:DUF8040 domain-containing protein n=1 Tax=Opuntia streptacantha TaxID=393608 RepID=A0A7C9CI48_OPUST